MTIEEAFESYIDFKKLKAIALRWWLQDKSIQKIQLYAGPINKPYVLLFSFSKPTIEGLWGHCMNGFGVEDWQSGWLELKQACIKDSSKDMRKWLVFAYDQSENQYLTSEYCWRNGKNTVYFEKDPEDMFDEASNLLPGGIRLTQNDFIGDSWILTESGFMKHVDELPPETLFENKKGNRGSFEGQVKIESENFTRVLAHIKTIGCKKIPSDEVVQLLEKNGIRYDYQNMTSDEIKATVSRLRENEISNRIIALILDWPGIRNRSSNSESVIRRFQRLVN